MGIFDFFKKKKTEEKTTITSAENNAPAAVSTTPPAAKPTTMSPEEIAEKVMILVPYIKQYRSQGMLDEEISAFLQDHSWPVEIIQRALVSA